MDRDDILRMALEAGLEGFRGEHPVGWGEYAIDTEIIERFADLVAAAEREACAKLAEERWLDKANCTEEEMYELQKKSIAAAIRARGQE